MALPELVAAEELFKGSVWDTLVDFGLSALFAEFPFLNVPIVSHLIKWLIRKFTDLMYTVLTEFINLQYVVLKNTGLQKKFIEHALKLKGIALESGIESNEYKNARLEHQKALAEKVRSLLVPAADLMLARADQKLQGMCCRRGYPSWRGLRRVKHWKNLANELRGIHRVA